MNADDIKIGEWYIVNVKEDHRLNCYNGRIVQVWHEQPNIPAVIGRYVIESQFDDAYNWWGFVNTADTVDLIPYEQGVKESMMATMKRINRDVEPIGERNSADNL